MQDHKGYLILIIALDSIYLNLYDDIANRLSEGVSQPCADDSSAYKVRERPNVQAVIFNKPWDNGVDLCAIVQESHVALPIDSGYVLNPVPSVKGVGIQEGSLHLVFYAWGVPSWGTFIVVTFPWGALGPFLVPSPLSGLKGNPALNPATSGQLQMK